MIRTLCSLAMFLIFASVASEPITEFELSSPGHRPQAITTGPDGNLWVTEVLKHMILKVTPDGKITEFPVPGEKVGVLQGIAAGPDGKIWFTSREENAVRRLTIDGKFDASFELPSKATLPKSMTPGCWPREIAPGPDKTLWLAEMAANKIACISADGTIKEFVIPTEHSQPYCVAMSKDNVIWFTESAGNKIGRLDPQTGKITEFTIPTADAHARELTPGPDGNIWFAENKAHKIGKLTLDGKFEEFDVPTKECQPLGITAGSDGNIWFCEFKVGKIGRITPAGKITEFTLPTPNAQPFCITSGPDGNIWVAEQANRIARIDLKTLPADK
jgi:virginiamycin B lyase